MWLSVPQRDVASARTTTCPGPADGWATSSICNPGAAFVLTYARTRRSYLSPTIPIGAVLVELPALARLAAGGVDPRPLPPLLPGRAELLLPRIERRPGGLFERLFRFCGGGAAPPPAGPPPRPPGPGAPPFDGGL